jgi:type VI secretion system ImpJ/VasE family protein
MHIHWHEGLFLQPHHLQIMQRNMLAGIRHARSLYNPHGFGVLESELLYDHLAVGRVMFKRLRAIMPSGQEVLFPESANLPPLDLNTHLARSTGALEIFLATPLWADRRANSFRQGQEADPRAGLLYIPDEARDVPDENSGENPQPIPIRKINARLVLKDDNLSNLEYFPLLHVARSVGDAAAKAQVDPDFISPCVLLRSSRELHGLVGELSAQLSASRKQAQMKLATGGLDLESKWELTAKLTVLNRFCGSLPSIIEHGVIPPFQVYLQLRELLGELLALQPQNDGFNCDSYNHVDPLPCFKELDLKIRALITLSAAKQPMQVAFSGTPGKLRAELESKHFESATGHYLLVTTKAERTALSLFIQDPVKFKLMPRSMEDAAITGLPLKEENTPPLSLPRQNDGYYFRLVPASNQRRWDQIKQEKSVSLVWNNSSFDLADAKFTLFMPVA